MTHSTLQLALKADLNATKRSLLIYLALAVPVSGKAPADA